jgi:hypothetical protein
MSLSELRNIQLFCYCHFPLHREREREGRGGGRYGEYSIFSSFADSLGANLGESDGAACLFICVVQDTDVSTSCCYRVSVIDTAPSANIA